MLPSSFRALACAALAAGASGAAAGVDSSALLDLEARIEYGYFIEDGRTLEGLASVPTEGEPQDGMKSYYAGLAGYRLTLLETPQDKAGARAAAQKCVSNLERALEAAQGAASAESLALQSACLDQLAQLRGLRAPFAGSKSKSAMQKALSLASRNPRVLLLDAVCAYERAPNGAEEDRALGKLKTAIAALENERQEVVHAPAWGLADAYTRLGRIYLDRGNTVAARDALEHALLAAPEFQQARRLMAKITSG